MIRPTSCMLTILFAGMAVCATAQDTPDVQALQSKIELLETKLQLAQKEIELLTTKLEAQQIENAELKRAPDAAPARPAAKLDSFEQGAIWKGEAKRVGGDGRITHWVLTVTERKGGAFKGTVAVRSPDGKVNSLNVEGRAPVSDRGLVEFKTERMAFGQLVLRGNLSDGQVGLIFVGTNPFGEPGGGAATLKRWNE